MWLWESWYFGPLDLGTLGPLPSSNKSSYFLWYPLTSSFLFFLLSFFGMVWYGGGLSFDIGDWDWLVTIGDCCDLLLEIDLWPLYWCWKVMGWVVVMGGWWVHLDYNISSGPFLDFDLGDWDWRWTRTRAWHSFDLEDELGMELGSNRVVVDGQNTISLCPNL